VFGIAGTARGVATIQATKPAARGRFGTQWLFE
jgi:hypothetical protein